MPRPVMIEFTQDRVEISGNTFPIKDLLKKLGARWNVEKKLWWFETKNFTRDDLVQIVDASTEDVTVKNNPFEAEEEGDSGDDGQFELVNRTKK